MKRICQRWSHRVFVLSALVACGLATAGVIQGTGSAPSATQLGATDAVRFQMAESGPGDQLVVPYFTAQAGQISVLHLVNTDVTNGKAVKLRYRGAGNADTLLDFVVLLSSGDVWAGAVIAGGDGKAQIFTADKSCTSPSIPSQGQPFSTTRLNPNWTATVQANNTREGYIEAILMADIPANAAYGANNNTRSPLYTAIQHVTGVAPCTQSVLDDALLTDNNSEAVAASRGFTTPTGGLMGGVAHSLVSPRDSTAQFFSNGNVFPNALTARAWIALATIEWGSWATLARGEEGTRYFDREGTRNFGGSYFMGMPSWSSSPWPGMVNVIAMGDERNSSLSASVSRKTISSGFFTNGWSVVDTPVPNTNLGLPVLGASFIKLTNPAAQPGVSGNYGVTWPHGYSR